eukprot:scaffold8143_cov142-Skeletonema_marinoi.AAC.10
MELDGSVADRAINRWGNITIVAALRLLEQNFVIFPSGACLQFVVIIFCDAAAQHHLVALALYNLISLSNSALQCRRLLHRNIERSVVRIAVFREAHRFDGTCYQMLDGRQPQATKGRVKSGRMTEHGFVWGAINNQSK